MDASEEQPGIFEMTDAAVENYAKNGWPFEADFYGRSINYGAVTLQLLQNPDTPEISNWSDGSVWFESLEEALLHHYRARHGGALPYKALGVTGLAVILWLLL